MEIKADNLEKEVMEILKSFNSSVTTALDEAEQEVAKEAVKKLRKTSPKRTGKYAKGWTVKKNGKTYIIYNKLKPWLTHLLEHGHPVVRGGKVVGQEPAHVHIAPVDEWIRKELPDSLAVKLQK